MDDKRIPWLSPQKREEMLSLARRANEARQERGEMSFDEYKAQNPTSARRAARLSGDGVGMAPIWKDRSNSQIVTYLGREYVALLANLLSALKEGRSVLLVGPTGTGKTALSVIAYRAYESMPEYANANLYLRWPTFLARLSTGDWNAGTEAALIASKTKGLLVVDDFAAQDLTGLENRRRLEYADVLVGERHDNGRTTVYTTNRSLDGLAAQMGDRIASRLSELTCIYMGGADLRRSK